MRSFSLDKAQKLTVCKQTRHFIEEANRLMGLNLPEVSIRFDLKGKSSGMFVVRQHQVYIRYNEMIFSEYYTDALVNTVAHEVAHYVVHSVWGLKKTKPHGSEWKQVMRMFGLKPEVTSNYKVEHIPLHKQRRFEYSCDCMTHQITTTRHNKVQRGKAVYSCRKCREPLKLVGD